MKIRRELKLTVGALVALQLITSAAALSALSEVGPALKSALRDNDASIETIEELLSITASERELPLNAAFFEALARADSNITEEAERPILTRLNALKGRAARAEALSAEERARLVGDLRALALVNRQAMRARDERAQRLSQAGAWVISLFGVFSFALALLVFRRLRERLELPLFALSRVTAAARAGDLNARLVVLDAPAELLSVEHDLNAILDERERDVLSLARGLGTASDGRGAPEGAPEGAREPVDEARAALLALLDARGVPCAVLNAEGCVVALTASALDAPALPHQREGLREGVREWVREGVRAPSTQGEGAGRWESAPLGREMTLFTFIKSNTY